MASEPRNSGDRVGYYCEIHQEECPKRDWCPRCELEYERQEATA